MHNICFSTDKFRDAEEIWVENENGIEGKGLCQSFKNELSKSGWDCESIFAEDFGWAFFANKDSKRYFVTASIDPDPDESASETDSYRPVGTQMFVNVNVELKRTLKQKMTGANKQTKDDPCTKIIFTWIKAQNSVSNLEVHT